MIIENDRLEILHANKKLYPNIIRKEPLVEDNINSIENAFLQNKAQYYLIRFFLKLHQSIEKLHSADEGEAYQEYLEALTTYIRKNWEYWRKNIKITSINDLDNLIHILKLSCIIIQDATQTQNIDAFFEAYYQVKSRLKKENLLK